MHRKRNITAMLAALAMAATLAVGVVAADEASAEPSAAPMVGVFGIEDMTWLLTSQVVDGEMTEIAPRAVVSLFMQGGEAGGNGGCNGYFTTYELDGFDLSFGPVGSTLMACLQPLMETEQAYFANLGQVVAYQSGGIQMAFLDANGDFLLEFDLAPAATVVGSWVATGINDQRGENAGVVSSATTSMVTADFSADGDLTGFDGCHNYFTTYTVDADTITIDPAIGQTKMACASDELEEQAQWYLGALTNAATWSVDAGGALQLRDSSGALQVSYAPAG